MKKINLLLNGTYQAGNLDGSMLAGCNFKLLEENLTFDYYFIMDPIFFKNPEQLSKDHLKKREDLFSILSDSKLRLTLIVPRQYQAQMRKRFPNLKIESIIFRSIPFISTRLDSFLVRLGVSLSSMNVIFAMLTYSLKEGFKLISIHGANHNWIGQVSVDSENIVMYHPDGFKKQESRILAFHDGERLTMAMFLKTQLRNFLAHDRFQALSRYYSAEIINMSHLSFITSYKRFKV